MSTLEWESIACALCGQDQPRLAQVAQDWLHDLPGEFRIVVCRQCGLAYQNPRPTAASLGAYYPADYAYAPSRPSAPTLTQRLRQAVLNRYYGYTLPVPALPGWATALLPLYHQLYRTLAQPIVPWRAHGRVLDVGCGKGDYLAELQRLGWEVHGVEINPVAVRHARETLGLPVFEGDLLQSPYPPAHFDVLSMWWYLEHIPNPRAILEKARQLLQPQGELYIGVPNWASFEARLFGAAWYHLDAPRHLYLFSPATLTKLLTETGFQVAQHYHVSWLNDPAQSVERWLKVKFNAQRALPRWVRLALAPWGWGAARLGGSSLLIVRATPTQR